LGTDTVLFVCTTCRAGEATPEGEKVPGARLAQALADANACDRVEVRPTECLSACTQGCSIALTRAGSWTYVYGRLSETDAPDILAGAAAYAQTTDGIVPWRQRPVIFRKQSLARIPRWSCKPCLLRKSPSPSSPAFSARGKPR
jgi:predicted metal-binding protein